MKIAFISSFYNPDTIGGAEIVVQNLSECLQPDANFVDWDDDGDMDIIHSSPDLISWRENDGEGNFTDEQIIINLEEYNEEVIFGPDSSTTISYPFRIF